MTPERRKQMRKESLDIDSDEEIDMHYQKQFNKSLTMKSI